MAIAAMTDRAIWQRRASRNAAAALILFALVQAICSTFVSSATGIAGIGLIAALSLALVIPALARFEARWRGAALDGADAEIARRFRRECALLWVAAAILPFAWTGLLLGMITLLV